MRPAVGPKTRLHLAARNLRGPDKTIMQAAAKAFYEAVVSSIEGDLARAREAGLKQLEEILSEFAGEAKKELRKKIDSMPHLKGDSGYTPIKGKDYQDGKTPQKGVDFHDGYTPEAGVDYPSFAQIGDMVAKATGTLKEELLKNGMTKEAVSATIAVLLSNLDAGKIARALEKLTGTDRLDYEALKNRPGTPVGERHVLHRGGGRETYYYDLSDQADGSAKTFAIPTGVRVVDVRGTDAPNGTYRPNVDWTAAAGQLTLTNEVAAPSEGATLYILYVR